MVLHDGETFINKEAPAMLQGLDEQIKVKHKDIFFKQQQPRDLYSLIS